MNLFAQLVAANTPREESVDLLPAAKPLPDANYLRHLALATERRKVCNRAQFTAAQLAADCDITVRGVNKFVTAGLRLGTLEVLPFDNTLAGRSPRLLRWTDAVPRGRRVREVEPPVRTKLKDVLQAVAAPISERRLHEMTGMSPSAIGTHLINMNIDMLVYIAGWDTTVHGRAARLWKWGRGTNVPCPKNQPKSPAPAGKLPVFRGSMTATLLGV